MVGARKELLRLGRRVAGGSISNLIHRASIMLAACCVLVAVWALIAVNIAAAHREQRLVARSPNVAQEATDPGIIGYFAEHFDDVDGMQYSVIVLIPTQETASPPVGLPRWPRAGEAFLSPRLADLDGGRVRKRYGTFGGLIGSEGLADPAEMLVYYSPPAARSVDLDSRMAPITGFGTTRAVYINQVDDYPVSKVALLVFTLLGLPGLVLLLVAVRSGAERRDARLAMLEALGATPRQRAWVIVGEATNATLWGVGAGSLLALLSTIFGVTVPITGYRVAAADLAAMRWMIAPVVVVVATGMLLAMVAAHVRPRRRAASTRPRAIDQQIRRWPWLVLAGAVTLALWGALNGGDAGRIAYATGMVVTLACLQSVAGWLGGRIGHIISWWGTRRGFPSALIGGRWLAARPAVIARVTAVFIVGLGLASQLQITETIITATSGASKVLRANVGLSVVTVTGIDQDRRMTTFVDSIGTDHVLRVFRFEDNGEGISTNGGFQQTRTLIVGTCSALRTLGALTDCPDEPVAFNSAYRSHTDAGRAAHALYAQRGETFVGTAAPPEASLDRLLLANNADTAGIDKIKETAFRTIGGAIVETPGLGWKANEVHHQKNVNWLLGLGLIALIMLTCAGALAAGNIFITQSRDLGPLAAHTGDRRFFFGVAAWNLTVPLVLAGACGAVAAVGLGTMLISMEGIGAISGGFIWTAMAIATTAAIAIGLAGGEVVTRAARAWRQLAD